MPKQTISQHFLAAKERPAPWVALRFKRHKSWLDLSWAEYFLRAEAVALGFANAGVKSGDRVAVLSNTRWEWAALDMGILGLGAVTIPVYQSSRPDEIEFILNDSEATALVVEDVSQLRKWEQVAKKCKTVKTVVCIQPPQELPEGIWGWDDFVDQGLKAAVAKPDFFAEQIAKGKLTDLATIVYTSGTTGQPKGAMLNHAAIISEVEDAGKAFPVSPADSTLSFLPYAHVLGRVELWLHTYVGFTLNFAENIDRLRSNLKDVKPTVIIGVPRIFEKIFAGVMTEIRSNPWRKNIFGWLDKENGSGSFLLNIPKHFLLEKMLFAKLRDGLGGRLRFTVSGGAPLEAQIASFFHRSGILILEGYGLTETTAAVTANTPSAFEFGTVGRPMGDVEIRLAEDGEILVKSAKVMQGYLHSGPDEESPFRDGFFCTGDIGEWSDKGFLRITDRKKDLIKTAGGKYVAPQKLEGLLKLDPLISNVLIHGDRKKYVVALVTLNEPLVKKMAREKGWVHRDFKGLTQSPEVRENVRKVIAQANAQLASYETIKNFAILPHDFTIESGELTPSLKVKRKVVDDRYKENIEELYRG